MKNLVFLFLGVFYFSKPFAQNFSYLSQKASGMSLSMGWPLYELPEGGFYRPALLNSYYRLPVFQHNSAFNLHINIKPQYAGVFVKHLYYFETGINVSFDLCLKLTPVSMIAYSTGSGPHFITYPSRRQANGFIFSDNFFLIYRQLINSKQNIEFELFTGIRHISNAGLKRPNGGINNWITGVSLGKLF